MTNSKLFPRPVNRNRVLSFMWIFVLMNMIYADILNTMKPGYLDELEFVSTEFSGKIVLLFAVLMEIPIIMILLSRFLNRKSNRIAHFIAVPLCILWVIVPSILSTNTPLSYIFFATVETIAMLLMLLCIWNWEKEIPVQPV